MSTSKSAAKTIKTSEKARTQTQITSHSVENIREKVHNIY